MEYHRVICRLLGPASETWLLKILMCIFKTFLRTTRRGASGNSGDILQGFWLYGCREVSWSPVEINRRRFNAGWQNKHCLMWHPRCTVFIKRSEGVQFKCPNHFGAIQIAKKWLDELSSAHWWGNWGSWSELPPIQLLQRRIAVGCPHFPYLPNWLECSN